MLNLLKGLLCSHGQENTNSELSFVKQNNPTIHKVLNYSYVMTTTMGNSYKRKTRGKHIPWSLRPWHRGKAGYCPHICLGLTLGPTTRSSMTKSKLFGAHLLFCKIRIPSSSANLNLRDLLERAFQKHLYKLHVVSFLHVF